MILFRAKVMETGKQVTGFYWRMACGHFIRVNKEHSCGDFRVDPTTLAECTGQKDKNDDFIFGSVEYEPGVWSNGGDTVVHNDGIKPRNVNVVWCNKFASWCFEDINLKSNIVGGLSMYEMCEILSPACDMEGK